MLRPDLSYFYHELRRRRVFRTTAYYLVGSWVLLQVCELVFDVLQYPEAVMQFVLAATIVGFPVALIFGWKYDITAQGIKRTPSASEDQQTADLSLKRLDYLLLSALLVITVVVAFQIPLPTIEEQQFSAPPDNSIAVMPFEVCEGQDLDYLMAAGLATEVINRLAERGRLKVLARESSFAFAGFGLRLPEIAEPLGVQHVLTGMLCRDEDTLILSAELSDAEGFLVSSDTFEQSVSLSGKITQTLASAVATRVAAELGDLLPAKPDALVNKLAYEQLIIGREHRTRGDDERARAAFERALEKQPNYAEALFEVALLELGPASSLNQGTNYENARRIAEQAMALVRRQLEYDAGSAHTQFVAGSIISIVAFIDEDLRWRRSGGLDEDEVTTGKDNLEAQLAEAEQHFRTSININPTATATYYRLASVVEGQGRVNEALEIYEQAQIRDPFNLVLNARIAKRWAARGRFRQAIELLQRFEDLPEIPPGAWWWQLELMQLQTYWDEKCATLIKMLQHDPGAFEYWGNRWQVWWFVGMLAHLGLYEEAEDWKDRLVHMPLPDESRELGLQEYMDAIGQYEVVATENQIRLAGMSDEEVLDAFHERGLFWALDLAESGDLERAIELMESIQFAPATWAEREAWAPLVLAGLYKEVGRNDEAEKVLDGIVSVLEAEYDSGIRHPQTLSFLAEAYAMQKRDDEAVKMFEKAVDYHHRDGCVWIDTPAWERFKDDPRVVSLCERIAADLEQQAERIRTMLAKHDVDTLLAPLMTMAADSSNQ